MELFFPILLIVFAVMFFLQLRGQKKKVDEIRTTQSSLTVGDRVVLTSGLHGTVNAISDTTIELELAPGTIITVEKAAVHRRVEAEAPVVEPEYEDVDDEFSSDEPKTDETFTVRYYPESTDAPREEAREEIIDVERDADYRSFEDPQGDDRPNTGRL